MKDKVGVGVEYWYVCKICKRAYRTSPELINHKRIHRLTVISIPKNGAVAIKPNIISSESSASNEIGKISFSAEAVVVVCDTPRATEMEKTVRRKREVVGDDVAAPKKSMESNNKYLTRNVGTSDESMWEFDNGNDSVNISVIPHPFLGPDDDLQNTTQPILDIETEEENLSNNNNNNTEMNEIPYSTSEGSNNELIHDFTESEVITSPSPLSVSSSSSVDIFTQFQEGEDVFYREGNGRYILGNVAQSDGEAYLIVFGDGSRQWSTFERMKKLSNTFIKEEQPKRKKESVERREEGRQKADTRSGQDAVHIKRSPENLKTMFTSYIRKQQKIFQPAQKRKPVSASLTPILKQKKSTASASPVVVPEGTKTCVSCGSTRARTHIAANNKYICRGCTMKIISGGVVTGISAQDSSIVPQALPALSINSDNDSSTSSVLSIQLEHQPQSCAVNSDDNIVIIEQLDTKSPLASNPSGLNDNCSSATAKETQVYICFRCQEETKLTNRVPCKLCQRPCHTSCLPLSPQVIDGDRFWDVLCSICGTQSKEQPGNARLEVFSSRRNVNTWADVADLLLSCLSVRSPEQTFFGLEESILPFMETNLDGLHLPKRFKNVVGQDRKRQLRTALANYKSLFSNGKEFKMPCSLWALRKPNSADRNIGNRRPMRKTRSK